MKTKTKGMLNAAGAFLTFLVALFMLPVFIAECICGVVFLIWSYELATKAEEQWEDDDATI